MKHTRVFFHWLVLPTISLLLTLTALPTRAQVRDKQLNVQDDDTTSVGLRPAQLEDFKQEVLRKMKELEAYITLIGDKSKPDDIRDEAIKLAIGLFGPDSHMQVTSLRTGKKNTYKMLNYFNQLRDLEGYTQVKITFYDVIKLDKWESAGPNEYNTTGTYFQQFEGIRNGKVLYTDRTIKKVAVKLSEREDAFYREKGWIVLLGNVTAEDTYAPPKQ